MRKKNFAWNHYLVNIHEILYVDILHQLLKGIVTKLIYWTQLDLARRIESSIDARKARKLPDRIKIQNSSWIVQLDDRFSQIPEFPGLRIFDNFSRISQWTGIEQKALLRQLVPVMALLLPDKAAMRFTRTVVDFMLQAQYKSHDDETLRYMNDTLRRMDLLKWIFHQYQNKNGFNFSKFHVLIYWTEYIRKFGVSDDFDTAYFEAIHIYTLKNFYNRTNKHENFEKQLLSLNTRHIKMITINEFLKLGKKKASTLYQEVSNSDTTLIFKEAIISLATSTEREMKLVFLNGIPTIYER